MISGVVLHVQCVGTVDDFFGAFWKQSIIAHMHLDSTQTYPIHAVQETLSPLHSLDLQVPSDCSLFLCFMKSIAAMTTPMTTMTATKPPTTPPTIAPVFCSMFRTPAQTTTDRIITLSFSLIMLFTAKKVRTENVAILSSPHSIWTDRILCAVIVICARSNHFLLYQACINMFPCSFSGWKPFWLCSR